MSTFMFSCPHCRQELEGTEELRGEQVACPSCDKSLTVPGGAAPTPDQTACPFCSEPILRTARKCKHCGEFLDGSVRPAATAPAQTAARDEAETTLWQGSPSMLYFLPTILLGIVLILMFGIGLLVLLYVFFLQKSFVFTVTNKRVMSKEGILSRKTSEVWIQDIRSINLSQGILERMFSLGTLEIASAGTAGVEVRFRDIPAPVKVKELINTQKTRLR